MSDQLPPTPVVGAIVRVRSRQYLVEEVTPPPDPRSSTVVRLSCLDDDAQGVTLEVLWEREIDSEAVDTSWTTLGTRGFDAPPHFAAYLHTLRWHCVTATTPRLFQAPWRAGIEVMAYQLEPLRKALHLPRVNLFIADDVGLGKTIEAGLVLREMLLRQKVRRVVIAVPASVVIQWREELERRFGLTFVVHDREYVAKMRRERGYAVNPWDTHSRFIISHSLLRDETYATPLRDWLGEFAPSSMLILDEAHHAAPASSAKYAIDSHFTRAVRDLAPRFEHRLFLSATPHNGLSNSFSALMEILDPQRFCRGVPIDPKLRDVVMVRRLKSDLRVISGGFPERKVLQIDLKDLDPAIPELRLASLLDSYWKLREAQFETLTASGRAAMGLVLINLQKRLLSSIEAFARTLNAHRTSAARRRARKAERANPRVSERGWRQRSLQLEASLAADDDSAELDDAEVEAEAEATVGAASDAVDFNDDEVALLDAMADLAESSRKRADARVRWIVAWIRRELCAGVAGEGKPADASKPWAPRRVVIFTEYGDTRRYLKSQIEAAISGTERAFERVDTFHGGMSDEQREAVKRAFNADPAEHPLRILIATDAAREGVNLQNHCADLIHFDLPWNPSRMEQRNGRIDRKLQRAAEVRCHYFVYAQRDADRVLEVLVDRTRTIQQELGSLPPVVEESMVRALSLGLGPSQRHLAVETLRAQKPTVTNVVAEEFESVRARNTGLEKQLEELRTILDTSRETLDLRESQLRDALSSSLEMLGAERLRPVGAALPDGYVVPALDRRPGADPTWADTLDTLRAPRERATPFWEWRRTAPVRPVVFRDPGCIDEKVVHLHLEHRLVQRLLGRFLAQGFVRDDLARACVGQTRDSVPRVLLIGRLSLYGVGAARLHDELVVVAARWTDPSTREGALKPYAEDTQEKAWGLLLESLGGSTASAVAPEVVARVKASASRDVEELVAPLEARAELLANKALERLTERGDREAREMRAILQAQSARISRQLDELAEEESNQLAFAFRDSPEELRQLQENAKFWASRLITIARELEDEPERIRRGYEVRARRVEPVGIAWLWPVTG